jgi:hypothetical protein
MRGQLEVVLKALKKLSYKENLDEQDISFKEYKEAHKNIINGVKKQRIQIGEIFRKQIGSHKRKNLLSKWWSKRFG